MVRLVVYLEVEERMIVECEAKEVTRTFPGVHSDLGKQEYIYAD